MPRLNDVIHFRGETVTLYATFKIPTGESAAGTLTPFTPAVKIEYATGTGEIKIILSKTFMTRMTFERYFFNWVVPEDAPLTVFNAVYSGVVDGKEIQSTEELLVGNPNVTTNRHFLRYGPESSLQESRTAEPRLSPQLPKGEF